MQNLFHSFKFFLFTVILPLKTDEEIVNNREHDVYGKRQTSDSPLRFLKITNKYTKIEKNNSGVYD